MNQKWYINEDGVKVKPCVTCRKTLPDASYRKMNEFGKLNSHCFDCEKEYHRKYRWAHRKTDRTYAVHKIFIQDGEKYKECSICGQVYLNSMVYFDSQKGGQTGLVAYCKNCRREKARDNKRDNWQKVLLLNARNSAKERGFVFDLSEHYVLELFRKQGGKCYWLGVDMVPSRDSKSLLQPSIDRIERNGGYTRGNVVLCTFAANFGRNENSEAKWKQFLITLRQNLSFDLWL